MGFRKVTKALEVAEQKGQNIRWSEFLTSRDLVSLGGNLIAVVGMWIALSIGIYAINPNYLRIGAFNTPVFGAISFMGFLHYRSEKQREQEQGNVTSSEL